MAVVVAAVVAIVSIAGALFGGSQALKDDKSTRPSAKPASSQYGPAILRAALKYDNERYVWAGGHPPTVFRPGKGLDCSGLVNVAVLEATGVNENNVAASFRKSKRWRPIKPSEAQPGDIMYRLASKHPGDTVDHVVIVVSNGGDGKLVVFEARTWRVATADEVRKSYGQRYNRFDGTLRFSK